MGLIQTIGDTANTFVNGATFGLFNRGIGALTGHSAEDVAAYNAATRERMGTTGDVLTGVAQVLPFARLAKGAQVATRAVQALRGVTAAEEAAPVLSTLARIRAAPVRYGTLALAGGAISRGDRVMAAEPGAATPTLAAAAAAPAAGTAAPATPAVLPVAPRGGRDAHGNLSIYSDEGFRYAMDVANARAAAANGGQAPAAAAAAPAGPALTPFQRQLAAFGQNGGVSLNELAVLAEASHNAQEPPTHPVRPPTHQDLARGVIAQTAQEVFQAEQQQLMGLAPGAAAGTDAHGNPVTREQAMDSAVTRFLARMATATGGNPTNSVISEDMAN